MCADAFLRLGWSMEMTMTFAWKQFRHGLIKGFPVCLGYIPVSFTFGIMAVQSGLPVWLAIFISISNLTSAGQFAGTQLLAVGAGLLEIGLTTLVINLRYMLMSLALSQRVDTKVSMGHRLLMGYGITDEIFAIAITETEEITPAYMYGLIITPVFGWTLGTAMGALTNGLLPASFSNAMGIALYAMFIAIIIPPAKQSMPVLATIVIAIAVTCLLRYIPFFSFVSSGFQVILATVAAAGIMAALVPVTENKATEHDVTEGGSQA